MEVPATGISLDTDFRLTDIAFDIGQQLKLEQEDVDKILNISRGMGANAKASTIHVNVWFGGISKAIGASEVLNHLDIGSEDAIFIGDSPNDESMFEQFEVTVGVHNIIKFLPTLGASPDYITAQSGGFGFVELAQALLAEC
ncbi:MAG: HAD hydrolase family protein [Desulfobulbaceae bacterium]|nr:HAD hydrolase family protein [Desulfobulbaceae bacterium]